MPLSFRATVPALAVSLSLLVSGCAADADAPGSAAGEGRAVDTVLGEVIVPEEITSVVVLEGRRDLDIVLSLGLPLAGYPYEESGALDLESPMAAELQQARDDGAEELFLADEINLEAIAAAEPDLIVSRADDVEPIRAELEAIAPVLAVGEHLTSTWQEDLRLVSEATGREDRAEALVTEYESRVKQLSEDYGDVLADTSLVPMSYNGEVAETSSTRLLSGVMQDLGVVPSQAFAETVETGDGVEYGPEQLLAGFDDADGMIALVNDPRMWEQIQDNPLYQQLPAVQNGHIVRSDKQTHEGAALTALHSLQVIEQLLQSF